jgi:ketopantoate hydroxymethyltransferase
MLALTCGMALTSAAFAQQPKALGAGDPAVGKPLVEKDCVACHERKFGDAAKAYTRIDRKVHSAEQLLAQVQLCNVELKSGYFPDEEEHVAAYLNTRFYGFKP